MNIRPVSLIVAVSLALSNFAYADNECNPSEFMDKAKVVWTEQLKISFILTSTKEQYEDKKQSWATAGGYGLFNGSLDYNDARSAAQKEASFRNYTSDYSTYLNYVSQNLGVAGADAYATCVLSKGKGPGLRLWVSKRQGKAFTVSGFWIGNNAGQGSGELISSAIVGGTLLQKPPKKWTKGDLQEILVVKDPQADAYLSLNVDGNQNSVALLADEPPVTVQNVFSKKVIRVTSGGPSQCTIFSETDCVSPTQSGSRLEAGSGRLEETGNNNSIRTGWKVIRDTELSICIEIWAQTPACETMVYIHGRVAASERTIVPPRPSHLRPLP